MEEYERDDTLDVCKQLYPYVINPETPAVLRTYIVNAMADVVAEWPFNLTERTAFAVRTALELASNHGTIHPVKFFSTRDLNQRAKLRLRVEMKLGRAA